MVRNQPRSILVSEALQGLGHHHVSQVISSLDLAESPFDLFWLQILEVDVLNRCSCQVVQRFNRVTVLDSSVGLVDHLGVGFLEHVDPDVSSLCVSEGELAWLVCFEVEHVIQSDLLPGAIREDPHIVQTVFIEVFTLEQSLDESRSFSQSRQCTHEVRVTQMSTLTDFERRDLRVDLCLEGSVVSQTFPLEVIPIKVVRLVAYG